MPADPSVVAGVPSRRGVTATDMVTDEATAQMYPAPTDGEAITARRLEVAGQWGHWIGVEMSATSHRPAPFFSHLRANLVCAFSRPASQRAHRLRCLTAQPSEIAGGVADRPRSAESRSRATTQAGSFGECGAIVFGDHVVVVTLESAS